MKITKQEQLRRERGMTKADLARAANVQANVIGWVEAGRFKPYPGQLERIAEILGVSDPSTLLDEIEVR